MHLDEIKDQNREIKNHVSAIKNRDIENDVKMFDSKEYIKEGDIGIEEAQSNEVMKHIKKTNSELDSANNNEQIERVSLQNAFSYPDQSNFT